MFENNRSHISKYVMKSEIVIATTKQNSDRMHKKSLLKFWYLLFYSLNYIAYKENFFYLCRLRLDFNLITTGLCYDK